MGNKHKTAILFAAAALLLGSCAGEASPETAPVTSGTTTVSAKPAATEKKKASTAVPSHGSDPETAEFSLTEPEYCIFEKAPKIFDSAPVAKAYKNGDSSALTQIEKDILAKAEEIIDSVITDSMTDYEKELAIHDYIITHCTYDAGTLAVIPNPSKNCEDPYGTLVNGSAICLGYTTTFRMFMDMLDIPCETVYSQSTDGDDHAWNIVTLNGSPYYVDVTWDDPVPDDPNRFAVHNYFNVSREYLAEEHVMPAGCPETVSFNDTYATHELVDIPTDKEELTALIKSFGDNRKREIYFIPEEGSVWQTAFEQNESGSYYFGKEIFPTLKECCANAGYCYAFAAAKADTSKGTALRFCIQYRGYMDH